MEVPAGIPGELRLGRLLGLDVSLVPSAYAGVLAVWVGMAALGHWLFRVPWAAAIAGGLALALLHMASEFLHHQGHAAAARATGYGMTGIRFWGPFAASIYPADEPELPASIHLRRAWGGPTGSAVATVVTGLVALAVWNLLPGIAWIAALLWLDNLLVFTLGALMPLGFTDGSTIIHWSRKG